MMEIKLKYNEGRNGIWSVELVKKKSIPKDIDFGWKFSNLQEDYRRIVARMMNSDIYKDFHILGKANSGDNDFSVAWVFKVSALGSKKVYYIRLQNTNGNLARSFLCIGEKMKRKKRLPRVLNKILTDCIKSSINNDLSKVQPVEYRFTHESRDYSEVGIAVFSYPSGNGEDTLIVRSIIEGSNYDGEAVGNYWSL